MSTIGELPTFCEKFYDWQMHAGRLEQFFEANEISEENKTTLLIISICEHAYKTLRAICHPLLPKEKTCEELIELLHNHYVVRTLVFRERVKFYTAKQYATESISKWFVRIMKLSADCKLGNNFDAVLLDRFISGLRPSPILDRLCEEEDTLTFKQAVEIAVNKESSLKASGEDKYRLQQGIKNKRPQKNKRNQKLNED